MKISCDIEILLWSTLHFSSKPQFHIIKLHEKSHSMMHRASCHYSHIPQSFLCLARFIANFNSVRMEMFLRSSTIHNLKIPVFNDFMFTIPKSD